MIFISLQVLGPKRQVSEMVYSGAYPHSCYGELKVELEGGEGGVGKRERDEPRRLNSDGGKSQV